MKSPHTGIDRILKAFTYSKDGFIATFKSEEAFRQDLIFCAVMFVIALILPVTLGAKVMLISALFIILLMELVNTAIEVVVDRISDEHHALSKKAKDIGSLLVLISFIHCAVVWLGIIIQRIAASFASM